MAVGHDKSWMASGRTGSVAGPEGQQNIDCWPKGPAKVYKPRNVAAVKQIYNNSNSIFLSLKEPYNQLPQPML